MFSCWARNIRAVVNPNTLMRQLSQLSTDLIAPKGRRAQLTASKGLVIFINLTQRLPASPGVGQFAAAQLAMRALVGSTRGEVNSLRVSVTDFP